MCLLVSPTVLWLRMWGLCVGGVYPGVCLGLGVQIVPVHVLVLRHGQMYFVALGIPVHCNSQVTRTTPVFFHFVVFLKDFDEMVDVFLTDVLNAKIVNYEGEPDGPSFMFPISWRDFALGVSCFL